METLERTQELNEIVGRFRKDEWYDGQQEEARQVFDRCCIREIREACLTKIHADCEEEAMWLISRVRAFLQINDYLTVFMLLRRLAQFDKVVQKEVVELMAEVVKKCLTENSFHLKDALVILCGKINRRPEFYNEKVREIFQGILEKYDGKDKRCWERDLLLVIRVFKSVARVKDVTLLDLIKRNSPRPGDSDSLFRYISIKEQEIILEGIRSLVIAHLESSG